MSLLRKIPGKVLVAFPGENNFTGEKIPLHWIKVIREFDTEKRVKILLDAAALCSNTPVDLTEYNADFVTLSFYKIFGYPTGCGALILRNEAADSLQKVYFGGGTVVSLISEERHHRLKEDFSARFEEGTVSFLSLMSLRHGFNFIQSKFGGIANIERHTAALTDYAYEELEKLAHPSGEKVVKFYGRHRWVNRKLVDQGPILAFNVFRSDGSPVGYKEFNSLAAARNINIRTGCFCNPGACLRFLNFTAEEVKMAGEVMGPNVCWNDKDIHMGRHTGAVRMSIGAPTTLQDVKMIITLIREQFMSGA